MVTRPHNLVVQINSVINENPPYLVLYPAQDPVHPAPALAPSLDLAPHPDPCLVLSHVPQEIVHLDDTEPNVERRRPMTETPPLSVLQGRAEKKHANIGSRQLAHLIALIIIRRGIGTRIIEVERDIVRRLETELGRKSEACEVGQRHRIHPRAVVAAVHLLKRTGVVCIVCLGR